MRPRVQTCLLLLVGVLTTPGTGGTIGRGDDRVYFDNGSGTDPSGAERPASFPFWKPGPGSQRPRNVRTGSPKVGVAGVSSVTLKEVSASTPGSLHVETSEPPMEIKPLLDEDVLVAFELSKMKTTQPPPTTVPVAAAAPAQPQGDNGFPSQLEELLKSILQESADREESTTQRQKQLPTVDLTSQKPPFSSTGDGAQFDKFLPRLEEVLQNVLVKQKPAEPQPPRTVPLPPPQTPRVPPTDAEKDFKHMLPTLEEALDGILKNNEPKVPTTTSWPVLPIEGPTATDTRKHFSAVLPQLQDAIRSVLEEAVSEQEATAQQHTSAPPPRQHSPPLTKDYGFGNFQLELERMFGEILNNRQSNHSATFPTTTVSTSTTETPTTPVVASTERQPSIRDNVIEPDSPS